MNEILAKVKEWMEKEALVHPKAFNSKLELPLAQGLKLNVEFGNRVHGGVNFPDRLPFVSGIEIKGKTLIPWMKAHWNWDRDDEADEWTEDDAYTDNEQDGTIDFQITYYREWMEKHELMQFMLSSYSEA